MRLTKSDKQAFVNSVMNDVPSVDYNEQARKLCIEWAKSKMPQEVLEVFVKFPGWIGNKYMETPNGLSAVHVPTLSTIYNTSSAHPDIWEKLVVLAEANSVQRKSRNELRAKVEGSIATCTSLKQAKERFPEFVKYLPSERDGSFTANLPAIANLVSELTAAGWPKAA